MRVPKIRLLALALVGSAALGGCAYGIGDPYGGYGGVNVGYSSGYGYGGGGYGYNPYGYSDYGYGSPYGYTGYGSYGSGYGYDPFGWYGNYYYPGTGIYVYDRNHHRRTWTNAEQNYWHQRMATRHRGTTGTTVQSGGQRENWTAYNRTRAQSSVNPVNTTNASRERWQRRPTSADSTATTAPARSDDERRGRRRGHSKDD